jgi:hypothetical protein
MNAVHINKIKTKSQNSSNLQSEKLRSTQNQLPVQSLLIVVSLNPTHWEVYSIIRYVVKIISDLRQVGGFL